MRYEQIQNDWMPAELDYFLQKFYGYSLWHFSLSLAMNIWGFIDYRGVKKKESGYYMLNWSVFWKKRIHELKQLKKKNIEILDEFLIKTRPHLDNWEIPRALLEKKASPSNNDYAENMFELSCFFKVIDDLIKRIEKFLSVHKIRGASYKNTNVIALIWSHYIKDRTTNKTQIVNITDLLKWFYDKFEDINYYTPLNKEIEELNNQKVIQLLYRYRHGKNEVHEFLINEVEYGKKLFEESIIGSRIISFKRKEEKVNDKIKYKYELVKALLESDWEEENSCSPLVTFPKGETLTVKDFKENSIKAKVSYENRAYPSILK